MTSKVKTRRMTIVVPESVYQTLQKATNAKNQTIDFTSENLSKVSDTAREALVKGLASWKKINMEAKKKAEEDVKKMNR